MSKTPFSKANSYFSNSAHLAARKLIYPEIFGVPFESLTFEDTLLELNERGRVLDGEMAIDRIVNVTNINNLRMPITFTVQERFRRPYAAEYQDITITEWNYASNQKSELYKLVANLFVYGYFDGSDFIDFIAINVVDLLMKICAERINYTKEYNPRSEQDFLAFKFSDLYESECVVYWKSKDFVPSSAAF